MGIERCEWKGNASTQSLESCGEVGLDGDLTTKDMEMSAVDQLT